MLLFVLLGLAGYDNITIGIKNMWNLFNNILEDLLCEYSVVEGNVIWIIYSG